MHHRITCMYINFQQNWVCRSVKPCTQSYLHNIASCIDLQLPIVIWKKIIILDMHHHKTYMCINFQQNASRHANTPTFPENFKPPPPPPPEIKS